VFAARRLFTPPPGLPFSYGGRTRSYHLHVPPNLRPDASHPLVLVLHGGGGNGFGMSRLTHFDRIADELGLIALYPDGIDAFWADGRGVTDADDRGIDDVGFLLALLDAVATEHRVDPARVFTAGISNGGFMAQRLACDHADRIAAIASVGATLPKALADRCRPSRPVPALFIHGTQDTLIPYAGGLVTGRSGRSAVLLSAPDSVRRWAERSGATTPIEATDLPNPSGDPTRLVRTGFTGAADAELVTVEGGGHTWPGGIQYAPARMIGLTSRSMDASAFIAAFFAAHSRV
jgi:polyhydroxybutyrate depolymerase